jgi:hypothetical protein
MEQSVRYFSISAIFGVMEYWRAGVMGEELMSFVNNTLVFQYPSDPESIPLKKF